MPLTEPPQTRARTKIVATVGPASRDPALLADLVNRGVDVFRINTAHGSRDEHNGVFDDIRSLGESLGRPVAILVDLAGPKIRLGKLATSPLMCEEGSEFTLRRSADACGLRELTCSCPPLLDDLDPGDLLMLADGTVSMQVVTKQPESVLLRVIQGGEIRSRQGINLPGVKLRLPAMTEKDRDNATWAAERGADFVSLSFVRSAVELRQLREHLHAHGSQAMIIAKIEKREALEDLDSIVQAADAIMVARGDLGVEIDVATTPVAQKRIITACQYHRRPVIVATEMLDSMQHRRRPTRAEATDVANAILDGADACMLSGETAIGEHPREAVEMMNRIMLATEEMLGEMDSATRLPPCGDVHPITSAVVEAAADIGESIEASLVVIASQSGATARIKAKQRDFVPTIGVSPQDHVLRQMCLLWGITPLPGAPLDSTEALQKYVVAWGREEGSLADGDRIVFVIGTDLIQRAHNRVEVYVVPSA